MLQKRFNRICLITGEQLNMRQLREHHHKETTSSENVLKLCYLVTDGLGTWGRLLKGPTENS
jgi:hypothetical protein